MIDGYIISWHGIQGVWRYVVQIPYEGYFTQTVEVVKCLSTKCEFLEGSCLASPR